MNPPDFDAIKSRQKTAWSSGDYGLIGTTLQIVGENLVEACDFHHDDKVLDVAAGNGNATLAAARIGCVVTSTDYVPALLEQGAQRAAGERLDVAFQVADAEELPFGEATFDGVLSTFGAMFTPNQPRAAGELLRVCKPGGRIGLANWTPDCLVGRMFGVLGKYLPPPAGALPPSLWGVPAHIEALFGHAARDIAIERRPFRFRYRSPQHFVDVFRRWYGPVEKAFAALSADAAKQLEADLLDLLEQTNVAGRETLVVPSDYLQIVITRA